MPVSVHTGVPVEHESVPVWHVFVGMQLPPPVHITQLPLLQTWFEPQFVPSGRLPVSVQTPVPEVQTMLAVRHGVVVVHEVPAVQPTQLPAVLQTWFVPQDVPGGRLPLFAQTGVPLEQTSAPARQAVDGVHEAPAMHVMQPPFEHTWFMPHEVPFAMSAPVSMHWGEPVAQLMVPA